MILIPIDNKKSELQDCNSAGNLRKSRNPKRQTQGRQKESTSANYAMKAEKHILPIFGNKAVSSIVPDDIYAFISLKQKAG